MAQKLNWRGPLHSPTNRRTPKAKGKTTKQTNPKATNKTHNQPNKNNQAKRGEWAAGQFSVVNREEKVISLYHHWYWYGGKTNKHEPKNKHHQHRHPRVVTKTTQLLQRYFQVSPKLLGFGEACPGVLKVSCCGVGLWLQEVCHSATTVSVVWLLALDFIFTRCVSPCPRISMLDVVQTGGLLDRSRTGAFDFSRLFKCGSLPAFTVETLGTAASYAK